MSVLSEKLTTYQGLVNKKREQRKGRLLEYSEDLTYQELSKRTHLSFNSVRDMMEGITAKPQNETLKKLVFVFIEEGVITNIEDIKSIWRAAGREGQVDEAWFQDTLTDVRRRGKIVFDEKEVRRIFEDKNPRGVTLFEAIETLGLVDIENRDDIKAPLPPDQIYKIAKREIVMTGVSLYHTFTSQDGKLLLEALAAKKWFYALLLDPNLPSDELERLKRREGQSIKHDIEVVIGVIETKRLDQYPTFQVRFLHQMPPFTAVMVDGDIAPIDETHPQDAEGQIRVQPGTAYGTQHNGPVFQFRKILGLGDIDSPFDYYAKDVRQQWKNGVTLDVVLKSLR